MRPGSSFDGIHLFCERERVWTNLLDERFRGRCLCDRRDETRGEQLQLDLGI